MTKENNNIINEILDNSIEGIVIVEDGFIKNLNNSLLEILSYDDKSELIGNLVTGILIPNTNEKYIEYNSKRYQELNLVTKNSETIPVVIKIIDIDDYTKIVYVLNLSELKEKEKLLLSKSKHSAMGEMISMIAHQWRQPLNALSSSISKILFKNNTNKLDKHLINNELDFMSEQIKYMSNTIEDFRNFFSQEKKKEHLNLIDISNFVVKMIYSTFELNNINIGIDNNTNLSKLYLYKNDLIQVIVNILNNSKDALIERSIKNPQINISFKEDEYFQYIFIEDNAGGIEQNIINNIFNPYFSTKDDKNGTGLGLYICKTIVEKKLEGHIYAKNKNNGVQFKIEIKK